MPLTEEHEGEMRRLLEEAMEFERAEMRRELLREKWRMRLILLWMRVQILAIEMVTRVILLMAHMLIALGNLIGLFALVKAAVRAAVEALIGRL